MRRSISQEFSGRIDRMKDDDDLAQSKLASIKKCRFEKRPRDSADENGEARRGSENGLDSNLDDNPDEFCDWNQAIDLGGRAESAHHSDMYDFG